MVFLRDICQIFAPAKIYIVLGGVWVGTVVTPGISIWFSAIYFGAIYRAPTGRAPSSNMGPGRCHIS